MSRKPRKISTSSIYHIVVKGIDRQVMFENDNDYLKYLEILELHKFECNFEIFAYVLMSNHVHLLIHVSDIPLATIFRKINTHYAVWFNMKYGRTGPLQQDRYYSEPVEDNRYFLSVIRYIHRNPFNAGLEKKPGEAYKWSSIYEYIYNDSALINTKYVLEIINKEDLMRFMDVDNADTCMDVESIRKRIPDDVAREIISKISGCQNSTDFQKLSMVKKKKYINILSKKHLSIRQINRLTGISIGIIQQAID